MGNITPKASSAKISVVGLFAVLTFALTLPMALLLSQEKQDVRSKAAEPTPNPQQIAKEQGTVTISGYVYYDDSKNGQREPGEKSYPNVKVKLETIPLHSTDAPEELIATADSNGFFKFQFSHLYPDTSTYKLTIVLPNGYKTINTNPRIFSELPKEAKENVEYGLFPTTLK